MTNRDDVIVCGRLLGTFDGWDEFDTGCMGFYNFEPAVGVVLSPAATLTVDYNKGELSLEKAGVEGDQGEVFFRTDLVAKLMEIPIAEGEQEPEIPGLNEAVGGKTSVQIAEENDEDDEDDAED